MPFFGGLESGRRTNKSDFGGDQVQESDPLFLNPDPLYTVCMLSATCIDSAVFARWLHSYRRVFESCDRF